MFNVDKETSNKTFMNLFHALQDDGLSYSASSSILYTKNSRLMKFDFNSIPETDKLTGHNYSELILSEIVNNIWFYFREIVKIPIPGQPLNYASSLQYPINKITYQMIWCYKNDIPFFVIYDNNYEYIVSITLKLLALYDLIVNFNKNRIMRILTSDVNKYDDIIKDFVTISTINNDPIPKLLINNFEESLTFKSINQNLTEGKNFEVIDKRPFPYMIFYGKYFGIDIFSNPNIAVILTELRKRNYQILFEGKKTELSSSEIGKYILASSPCMDIMYTNTNDDNTFTNKNIIDYKLKSNIVIIDTTIN